MMISIIVAIGNNNEIGNSGKLLWKLPADLKNFKSITIGHHVIMGRKTFESIGKPLPGRTTVIVSRQKDLKVEGCLTSASLENALKIAKTNGDDEAIVIGGGEIYKLALPLADKIYLSKVDYNGEADTFFPTLDLEQWVSKEITSTPKTDKYLAWTYQELFKK
jgi:dihydrofolate reductase